MKTCTKCGETKELTEFAFKNKLKETYQSRCRKCYVQIVASHYQANSDKVKRRARARELVVVPLNREYIDNYLSSHPCVDCGEDDIIVLDFDHVRGVKRKNVSKMLDCGLEAIQSEIDKCEVRCANCHRRRHYMKRLGE